MSPDECASWYHWTIRRRFCLVPEDQMESALLRLPRPKCGAWYEAILSDSAEEESLLNSAARALVFRRAMPELTLGQRAKLAWRLQLVGEILSQAAIHNGLPVCGNDRGRKAPRTCRGTIAWLLSDGWPLVQGVALRTLGWAFEEGSPLHPPARPQRGHPSGFDPATN